uniref:Uncharacterized protein n=1 Tax=Cyclophora tenuis TaxID=216820 RepID=A0A7S1GKE4_CYCTE|mmetsp:Transcript_19135/g.32765  ORF Transcript_19135/g.32765 Transcript_19135/m.32765 type:complete len:107 (+) Transcript_19135:2-322(+)
MFPSNMVRFLFIISAVLVSTITAFAPQPLSKPSIAMARSSVAPYSTLDGKSSPPSVLQLAKKQQSESGDNQVDYGQIVGMMLNPLNPYSWFLYFFIFIFGFNAIQN